VQYGGHSLAPAKGSILNTTFVKDTLIVVYSDLNVGSYRVLNLADSFVAYQDSLQKLRCTLINQDSLPGSYPYLIVAIALGGRNQELTSCTLQQFPTKNLPKHLPTASMRAVRRGLSKAFLFKSTSSISASSTESVFLLRCDYFDSTISVFSTEAPQREYKCNWLHRGPITCIAVGENGLVVTGGNDATCRVYILDHPEMVMALLESTTTNSFRDIMESDQIQRLACIQVLWGHNSSIQSICVSSLLDIVVSGGTDGTICVHKALSGELIRFIDLWSSEEADVTMATRKRGIRRIAVCKWGLLVIHSEDGMLHKGTVNGDILLSVDARDTLNALEISSEGEIVVSGGQIGHFLVRNLGDLSVVYTLDLSMNGPIEHVSFSQKNSSFTKCCICVGSKNGAIVLVYPEVID
jgi:WD40 repeat protein